MRIKKVGGNSVATVTVLPQPVAEQEDESKANVVERVVQTVRRVFILFILPEFRIKTLVVIICWCGASMVYYGLALNANNIKYVTHRHRISFYFLLSLIKHKHIVSAGITRLRTQRLNFALELEVWHAQGNY